MAHNPVPGGSGRPTTRRTSVIESPAPSGTSVSSVSKSDKMKSVKEVTDIKDKKVNDSNDSKDNREKASKSEEPKVDVAAEFKKFREDMGKMFKESEDKMSNIIKESENRMSDKLNSIENKFSVKMEGLREEMKTEINDIKEEIEHRKSVVNEEVNTMKETVFEMEKSVQDNSDRMFEIEKNQKKMEKDQDTKIKTALDATKAELDEKIEKLDVKLKLLEKQDRKYNLLFYGFPEEGGENVYDVIRQSLITELKLDEERVNNMYFAAGHRVPSKAAGPKPIIIRCTSLEDRELILSESKNYGGLKKRVVVDWPQEMKEERGRLSKLAYEIRKSEGKQTRIKDKGLEVFLEVRNNKTEKWAKRVV